MSSWRGARIGSVPYLNARPLVEGLEGVRLATPVELARALRTGEVDAALVPVIEAIENPGYVLVDGVGIGADGEVASVFVAHRRPREEWRRVARDPDSRTSNRLAEALFEGVEWVKRGEEAEAELWIGDPAIRYRAAHPEQSYVDLGAEWKRQTGLPFVFAVWALRREFGALAEGLREAAQAGLAARRRIAKDEAEYRYLTENIRYGLGAREKAGIAEFARRSGFGTVSLVWA